MVYAYSYRRQTLGFSSLLSQQQEIHRLSVEKSIAIDKEVVEYASKNLPLEERKEFESFLRSMQEGNTIIVASLSILSDRAEELIKIINCILTHNVDLWIATTSLCINQKTTMIEIFPLLNTLREEGQDKDRQTGRPKGSQSTSKFDIYHGQIVSLLAEGLSVSAISRELEVSRSSLKDYISSRNIKDLAEGMGKRIAEEYTKSSLDNIVLICPFEEAYRLEQEKGR